MNVLAVGAHPDDVELGCGGVLLAHRARGDRISLLVMTAGEQGPQAAASRVREQEEAAEILGAALYWGGFEDGAIPDGRTVVGAIDAIIGETGAEIVYTHAAEDTHQDHRATHIATLGATRRVSRVLTYETPTSTSFLPTLYAEVTSFFEEKRRALEAHRSQIMKNRLVDLEALEALARHRGFEARIPHGLAEGFGVARFVWNLGPVSDADSALPHKVRQTRSGTAA